MPYQNGQTIEPVWSPAPSVDTVARTAVDLSIVIPALNEGENLDHLLPRLQAILRSQGIRHEILVVTDADDEATRTAADRAGAQVCQAAPGYGNALLSGFARAAGPWILTMDAD